MIKSFIEKYGQAINWALRGILIGCLFRWFQPAPIHVHLDNNFEVESEHPVLCVHTRLTDEVEEWKVQRSLAMVREMGASMVVEFLPWAYLEPEKGTFNWGYSDRIINHALDQGLEITVRLGLVPGWARPDEEEMDIITSLNYLDSEHYEDFADFVEAFSSRYRGEVDRIIIWNEPNLAFEWGYQTVSPEQYIGLLNVAVPAARSGNPDIIILAGALAPTLEPVGSPYGYNDLEYLQALFDLGFGEYYDVLAVHTYGFKFPPETEPGEDILNFRRIELLREIMVGAGDAEKSVIITEFGWNDHPRWTRAVSPGQRITYTIDALEFVEGNYPWVENACIWALRYPVPVYSYPDYYTLVSEDFSLKPIYSALSEWSHE